MAQNDPSISPVFKAVQQQTFQVLVVSLRKMVGAGNDRRNDGDEWKYRINDTSKEKMSQGQQWVKVQTRIHGSEDIES